MECKTLKQNIERYCSKVDTDRWTEFVRDYSAIGDSLIYGGKHGGSDAEHAGAEYIAQQLRSIGVEKVEIDYVEKKHVKKANGGAPGFVIYHTNYSMVIDSDISGISRID